MDLREKLELLKSLQLFERVPREKLSALAAFLEPVLCPDRTVIFEEGSKGDSLYFVSAGRVRIQKRLAGGGESSCPSGGERQKDLAILGPGDCLGEMVAFEERPRSARALAMGETLLFKLGRADLLRWLKSNPSLAVGFFTELVQVLSKRLRRSSNELTLLFDLGQWLLEPVSTGGELLHKALRHLVPHLEGAWAAGAWLYNEFNDEMELVAREGSVPAAGLLPAGSPAGPAHRWLDDATYYVALTGERRLLGYLVFRASGALPQEDKVEIGRTLATAASLVASALENVLHRTEEALRARLASARQSHAG